MTKVRAIYIGDVRFNTLDVFELDKNDNKFKMIVDNTFQYDIDMVIDDEDWLIFEVNTDDKTNKEIDGEAVLIKNKESYLKRINS